MAKWGSVDFEQLKRLYKRLEKLEKQDRTKMCEETVKELAARMLAKLIKKTPVGNYKREIKVTAKRDSKYHKKGEVYTKRVNTSKKQGGTLRKGWTGGEKVNASEVEAYVQANLNVTYTGDSYCIELINPVEYASYVNSGHRTKGHKGWVPRTFFC